MHGAIAKGLVAVAVMASALSTAAGCPAAIATTSTKQVHFKTNPWVWCFDVERLGTHKPPPNHYDLHKPTHTTKALLFSPFLMVRLVFGLVRLVVEVPCLWVLLLVL